MAFSGLPNDPLFQYQWGLKNTGQSNGAAGVDIDVLPVWPDYTGTGIRVGVIDDGTQLDQPDLAANIDPNATWDASQNKAGGGPVTNTENHGTATAGIIAAAANNGIGGTGVAPNATLGIYHVALGRVSYQVDPNQFAIAFAHALGDHMDVVSNSWGSTAPFSGTYGGIQNLAQQGRNGLGTVVVFANGNSRVEGANGILNATDNSRYVIAVAAIDNNGVVSAYSTPGANLLVSAPGGASTDQISNIPGNGIITTDRTGTAGYNTTPGTAGDDAYDFNGTSAATPFVSGVAALVLQANPNLTYRDVQDILAESARLNDPSSSQWIQMKSGTWNGGGNEYNVDYGFGLVDARAAVRLAESFAGRSATGTEGTEQENYAPPAPVAIANDPTGDAPTLFQFTISQALSLEHVSLDLDLTMPNAGTLNVTLTSPGGSVITLLQDTGTLKNVGWPQGGFTLTSPAFWGEQAKGTWTVRLWDDAAASATPPPAETVNSASLSVQGSQTGSQDLIYTDDFATLAARDPSRLTLTTAQANATLNASAVSGAVSVNLPAHSLSINGTAAAIDPAARIGAVYSGDGNDTLVGGASAMTFTPGRGSNTVVLGDAANVVHSMGNDTITGTGGAATVNASGSAMVFSNDTALNFIGQGGASTVVGGSAAIAVSGGAGQVTVWGSTGGGDSITGGTGGGNQLTANGNGSTLFSNGTDNVLYGSQTGASTLVTQGSGNTVFGGAGGGTVISHGSHDLVILDEGASTLFGGNDAAIFTNGANADIVGDTGSMAIGFGSGASTAWASSGTDLFLFANGEAGGTVTLNNFQAGKDFIQLSGYGTDAVQDALTSAVQTAAGLSLTLSDQTSITLTGITALNQSSFIA